MAPKEVSLKCSRISDISTKEDLCVLTGFWESLIDRSDGDLLIYDC